MITSDHRYNDNGRQRIRASDVLAFAVFAAAVAGVFIYVLAMRLEPIVLALIAVVGITSLVAVIAMAALALVILRRNGKQSEQHSGQQYTTIPPQIMVVPPMNLPHSQLAPPSPSQFESELLRRQRPRHFTVVGEGNDEFWSGA